ncbi:MAG: GNAT family N-acetyltransferase, partial [Chloroflexi bacterium]|nr:GNAT family N-acetyltransferase [Chloroflexota bacterium]
MGHITVREAKQADLPALLRLLDQMDESMYPRRQAAREGELRELFQAVLRDPNQHLLLAEAGRSAVGTAHVMVLQHFDRPLNRSAVVEGVVVDRIYRDKGVGAALMR